MARKPRVEFPGAFYHVISRGNRREAIFHGDEDRSHYLTRLERYRRRHGLVVYAYVLMDNHVHLLVETGLVPLSRTMQVLQFTYTQHYNRKYGKVGHLFQGRYKAILCDRDAYLLELVRYIHLNPARLRRPVDPFRYRWSSHGAYRGEPGPVKVEVSLVLGQFSRRVGDARRAFEPFMREGLSQGHQDRFYDVVDQRFLGGEEFVERVDEEGGHGKEMEPPVPRAPLRLLLATVAELYRVDSEEIVGRHRSAQLVSARSLLVFAAREWSQVGGADLSRTLGRGPSMLSLLYTRYLSNRNKAEENRLAEMLKARL